MMISIAIDGPAGAGKSTISKLIAKRLNIIHVDTGALYRAVGLYMIRNDVPLDSVCDVKKALIKCDVSIKYIDGEQRVFLNGDDVSDMIRTSKVSMAASAVSSLCEVRSYLLDLQRNLAISESVVMDGRDIGTVVLPNADVKIFLTASVDIRAKRRYFELLQMGEHVELEDIVKDIKRRDLKDSERKTSPLVKADDAVLVDTSDMSLDESADMVVGIVEKFLRGGI